MNVVILVAVTQDRQGYPLHRELFRIVEAFVNNTPYESEPVPTFSGVFPKTEPDLSEDSSISKSSPGTYSFHDSQLIRKRFLNELAEADAVVAEITIAGFKLGLEIATALELGIPVLCLRRKSSLSHFNNELPCILTGHSLATVRQYNEARSGEKNPDALVKVVWDFLQAHGTSRSVAG